MEEAHGNDRPVMRCLDTDRIMDLREALAGPVVSLPKISPKYVFIILRRLIGVTLQKEANALNQDFFAREAEACKGLMYRVAYTILQNDADCQDAVQDALLKAWAKRNSLRNEKLFRTWLTRILINACHDLVRKRRRVISLDALPEPSEEFPDLVLAEALEKLPEKYRVPLMLFYSENMTYAEIGKALRIPVTSVQSRIRRGKTRLRKELNEDEA
ncbi:MAG: sigma-70 family RNA polymerase sigma factor [Clostridia bacterium]|nr:sigma-70 family RNA polymerase sigma factor [Clostridia bacterium]